MDAYSQDLRDRVLRALERGERPTAIAARFEVSRVWVYQVRSWLTQTGQRSSLPIGGHRQSRLVEMEPTLRTWLKETGDLVSSLRGFASWHHGNGADRKDPGLES